MNEKYLIVQFKLYILFNVIFKIYDFKIKQKLFK